MPKKEITEMTLSELLKYAEDNSIEIVNKHNKQIVLAVIEAEMLKRPPIQVEEQAGSDTTPTSTIPGKEEINEIMEEAMSKDEGPIPASAKMTQAGFAEEGLSAEQLQKDRDVAEAAAADKKAAEETEARQAAENKANRDAANALKKKPLNQTEVLYAFIHWLNSCSFRMFTLGAANDNQNHLHQALAIFCKENNLPELRDGWLDKVTFPVRYE